ncbi:hypothetical protein PILCRDRAFT_10934 [Piloderma croceum F 1598]|uniref:Uncharacterized protein n=1 Tax=Piloderma croceum (strain F 1598) TaxID=765440 RepID=A0A0C3BN40_PILCF|nr:hypothetical protein PILCRDRAFT_10934 [Piloderma croceum F 1598]
MVHPRQNECDKMRNFMVNQLAVSSARWSSTSITASLDSPSFVKVAIPSTTPTLMSSVMKPSLVLKIPSAPSSPFQTIILLKREMVPGYPNLARPPRCLWEYRREEEKKEEKFDWFTSSEDDIREEVASILKAREFGLE